MSDSDSWMKAIDEDMVALKKKQDLGSSTFSCWTQTYWLQMGVQEKVWY